MSDLAARLELLSTDLEECDACHNRILTRLQDSLEVASQEIHLAGLGARRYTLHLTKCRLSLYMTG